MTPNGKLDRKALPAPEGRQAGEVYIAPQNELEKLIAGVWQESLGLKEVGLHDNFFESGATEDLPRYFIRAGMPSSLGGAER